MVAGSQQSIVAIEFHRRTAGDDISTAEHIAGILWIRRRGGGTIVDIDPGNVISVVDEVLGYAVDAPVFRVAGDESLRVHEQLVLRIWPPGDRTIHRVRAFVLVDEVALR